MLPTEAELLEALAALIVDRSAAAKANTVEVLARYLTVAYELGGQQAGKEVGSLIPIGLDGLDPVINKLAPVLDETFSNLSGELTGIIEQGIRKNSTYAEVRNLLVEKLDGGLGASPSPSPGPARPAATCTSPRTAPSSGGPRPSPGTSPSPPRPMPTPSSPHEPQGCLGGRAPGTVSTVRPEGLGLHGRRRRAHPAAPPGSPRPGLLFGTEDEAMAMAIMEEPNCRCRPRAWFDDPPSIATRRSISKSGRSGRRPPRKTSRQDPPGRSSWTASSPPLPDLFLYLTAGHASL